MAEFVYGAACDNGEERPERFFIGELSIGGVPGEWWLSSPAMWVCSGSPAEVKKCGGSLKSSYKSEFTNATAEQNRISGKRKTQARNGCTPGTGWYGEAEFTLTRLPPCAEEERKLAERQKTLSDFTSSVQSSRAVLGPVYPAALARYGPYYQGRETTLLEIPGLLLTGWEADNIAAVEVFWQEFPRNLATNSWKAAKDMAAAMGMDSVSPLPAATVFLQHMHRMEQMAPEGARYLSGLQNARRDLEACRRMAPQ